MFVWFRRLCSRLYKLLRRRGIWIKKEVKVEYWTQKDAEAELKITRLAVQPVDETIDTVYVDRISEPLSRLEIQRRVKDARRKRQHLKPSSKHFPPTPAFEKRHWDKEKKMEDS